MIILSTLIILAAIALLARFTYKLNREVLDVLSQQKQQVQETENEIAEEDPNIIPLDENVPFPVPPTVKFEVEGGDTMIPPEMAEDKLPN